MALGTQVRGGERVMVLWRVGVGKSMLMLRLMRMLVCVRQRHKACAGSEIFHLSPFFPGYSGTAVASSDTDAHVHIAWRTWRGAHRHVIPDILLQGHESVVDPHEKHVHIHTNV